MYNIFTEMAFLVSILTNPNPLFEVHSHPKRPHIKVALLFKIQFK
jgi:hypothetical protein